MKQRKEIKHEYNKYGYSSITPNYISNKSGIYPMQQIEGNTYLEVYCSPNDVDEVTSQINRHVDGVESVAAKVDLHDSIFVIEGDETSVFETHNEALLNKLDPDNELSSLVANKYVCTFSRKCDDIVKNYTTDRTQVLASTIDELITELLTRPYIHKLDDKLSKEQKEHLYELSLRIQDMKGITKETREVVL